jgi:hypothetical protein
MAVQHGTLLFLSPKLGGVRMKGRYPKTPALRRGHRRKEPGPAGDVPVPRRRRPALPKHRKWLPQTREWWAAVWAAPTAQAYEKADVHGLLQLAVLVDLFWSAPEPKASLAAEIRLQSALYGLSPLDRRRFDVAGAKAATAQRKAPRAGHKTDPRELLRFPHGGKVS